MTRAAVLCGAQCPLRGCSPFNLLVEALQVAFVPSMHRLNVPCNRLMCLGSGSVGPEPPGVSGASLLLTLGASCLMSLLCAIVVVECCSHGVFATSMPCRACRKIILLVTRSASGFGLGCPLVNTWLYLLTVLYWLSSGKDAPHPPRDA